MRLEALAISSGENPHDFITCSIMENRFGNWVLVTRRSEGTSGGIFREETRERGKRKVPLKKWIAKQPKVSLPL